LIDFVLPEPPKIEQKFTSKFVRTFPELQTEYFVDLQCLLDQRSLLMIEGAGIKLWDIERDIPSVSPLRVSQTNPELTTSAVHSALTFGSG
jgi:hypothetical protein